MARTPTPYKIRGDWFEVDVVEERVVNGELVVYIDPDSYKILTRKHWGYWWNTSKALILTLFDGLLSPVRRLLARRPLGGKGSG